MSAQLPQLPSFLSEPLACPLDRSLSPGRLIPSPSNELSPAAAATPPSSNPPAPPSTSCVTDTVHVSTDPTRPPLPCKQFEYQQRQEDCNTAFPRLAHYLPLQFCPPDRSCGQPPRLENFELVNEMIGNIFKLEMCDNSLTAVMRVVDTVRADVLALTIEQNISLEWDSWSEEQQIRIIEDAVQQGVLIYNSGAALALTDSLLLMGDLFRTMHHARFGSTGVPSFHSLSLLTTEIAEYHARLEVLHFDTVARHSAAVPSPITSSHPSIVAALAARSGGPVAGKKEELRRVDKLSCLINAPVYKFILRCHDIFTPSIGHLAHAISPVQVLEEVGSLPLKWSALDVSNPPPARFRFLVECLSSRHLESSDEAKLRERSFRFFFVPFTDTLDQQGDIESKIFSAIRSPAIDSYQLATMIDPANFQARLNSAAVRLRGVFDAEEQASRFSRVVYDCTAALYYGPASYKAYYRRGYALTHLEMWSEAVLDFEQALLLEPTDVLLQYCLSAAKRRVRL